MKKKVGRNLKLGNVLIMLEIIVLIPLIGIYAVKELSDADKNKIEISKEEVISPKIEEVREEKYQATMIMAGDNLIHKSIIRDALKSDGTYDFRKMYEYIKPIVSQYDIAYYNQETILGGVDYGYSGYPTFNSPQEVGDAMRDTGFNLVTLATNHTLDKGEKAVLASRRYWNSFDDVLAVGSYSSFDERNRVEIREANGITYTLLNYTYGTNGIPVPLGKEYLVNVWPQMGNNPSTDTKYQEYKNKVKQDIEVVRDSVDILMVGMHWGVEYTHEPTVYEKDIASFLASLGVDVIIGTHPHVIQPVTWIDDTLVIYSLGNFISAQYQDQNYNKMVGLMTSLEINKTVKGDDVSISIDNVENDLVYTYYKNWSGYKVVPFSNSVIANYLPDYKIVYERYKNIVKKYDANMQVKALSS